MMARALELAAEARSLGEVPVGAVVVRSGRIIAQAFNLRETLQDPTAHAERLALTWAGRALGHGGSTAASCTSPSSRARCCTGPSS